MALFRPEAPNVGLKFGSHLWEPTLAAFFMAVADNTSITCFEHWDCTPFVAMMFTILAPRFSNGLHTLKLINIGWLDVSDIQAFITSLETCNRLGSTLKHVEFSCITTRGNEDISPNEAVSQLIDALGRYCSLVKFTWEAETGENGFGNHFIQSLARFLNALEFLAAPIDLAICLAASSCTNASICSVLIISLAFCRIA